MLQSCKVCRKNIAECCPPYSNCADDKESAPWQSVTTLCYKTQHGIVLAGVSAEHPPRPGVATGCDTTCNSLLLPGAFWHQGSPGLSLQSSARGDEITTWHVSPGGDLGWRQLQRHANESASHVREFLNLDVPDYSSSRHSSLSPCAHTCSIVGSLLVFCDFLRVADSTLTAQGKEELCHEGKHFHNMTRQAAPTALEISLLALSSCPCVMLVSQRNCSNDCGIKVFECVPPQLMHIKDEAFTHIIITFC